METPPDGRSGKINDSSSRSESNASNDTAEILRWLMLNRQEVTQTQKTRDSSFRQQELARGRKRHGRVRSLALTSAATISTYREYVGTDMIIVIGFGITFVGTAVALVGFFVPFGNTEIRPLVLGIGLATVAVGLFTAGARIFMCRSDKTERCGCCFNKIKRFPHIRRAVVYPTPTHINISSLTSSTCSLSRLSVDYSSFVISHSQKTLNAMLKSSFRSTTKPSIANRVNFDPAIDDYSTKTGVKEAVWQHQTSPNNEVVKSSNTKPNPSSYLDLVEDHPSSNSRKTNNDTQAEFEPKAPIIKRNTSFERHDLTAGTEKRLNEGLDKTRRNSADFHEDFSNTISILGWR